jgi:hypothetical protein
VALAWRVTSNGIENRGEKRELVGELQVLKLRFAAPVWVAYDTAGRRLQSLSSEVAPYLNYAHGF